MAIKYVLLVILSLLSVTGYTSIVILIFEKSKFFSTTEIYPLRIEYFYWILIFAGLKFLKLVLSFPLKENKAIRYDLVLSGIGVIYVIHFLFFRSLSISFVEIIIGLLVGLFIARIEKRNKLLNIYE